MGSRNQRDIELYDVGLQPVEMPESGLAGDEIVYRQLGTALTDRRKCPVPGPVILNRNMLGELNNDSPAQRWSAQFNFQQMEGGGRRHVDREKQSTTWRNRDLYSSRSASSCRAGSKASPEDPLVRRCERLMERLPPSRGAHN